jgi:hypothetical protein
MILQVWRFLKILILIIEGFKYEDCDIDGNTEKILKLVDSYQKLIQMDVREEGVESAQAAV